MKIKLANVRLSFPDLFTAKGIASDPKSKPTFGCALLIDPAKQAALVKEIEAGMAAVAKAKWGAKADAMLKKMKAGDKVALHDGATKTYDGYEDMLFLSTSSKTRPLVMNRDKSPIAEADGIIYSGCYVNASVELWAQDNAFGQRINAQLGGVQFAKDGDAFAGGGSAADESDFDALEDGADADSLV